MPTAGPGPAAARRPLSREITSAEQPHEQVMTFIWKATCTLGLANRTLCAALGLLETTSDSHPPSFQSIIYQAFVKCCLLCQPLQRKIIRTQGLFPRRSVHLLHPFKR
ncbi:uncharacterized protein RHO17_011549 [Thomomys bottae]